MNTAKMTGEGMAMTTGYSDIINSLSVNGDSEVDNKKKSEDIKNNIKNKLELMSKN